MSTPWWTTRFLDSLRALFIRCSKKVPGDRKERENMKGNSSLKAPQSMSDCSYVSLMTWLAEGCSAVG
jgi:hypothetical protein